jgi:hypothetical protein
MPLSAYALFTAPGLRSARMTCMGGLQLLSLLGAIQVLAAYIADPSGRMSTSSRRYSALNAVGSGLAYVALREVNYGFILLEGVWALVSPYRLIRPGWSKGRA